MTYKYTIKGEKCSVGGSNNDLDWIMKEKDSIMKTLFPNYVLCETISEDPWHLVYDFDNEKIYFKVEKEEENG
jgi:hypothetical protein